MPGKPSSIFMPAPVVNRHFLSDVPSDGDDVIYAGALPGGSVFAGGGNDTVFGTIRSDRIDGGPGNDRVYGGSGNDTLLGGFDNDVIYGGPGDDTIYGSIDPVIRTIPLLGDDVLHGGAGNDIVQGDAGNDLIYGDAGDDWLRADYWRDQASGASSDQLYGGAGADRLDDGHGSDFLDGGTGNDVIYLIADGRADAVRGGEGTDTLVLFSIGGGVPQAQKLIFPPDLEGGPSFPAGDVVYALTWLDQSDNLQTDYVSGVEFLKIGSVTAPFSEFVI